MTASSYTTLSELGAGSRQSIGENPDRTGDIVANAQRGWPRHLWWIALVLGVGGSVFVWLGTPHVREIESAWHLGAKVATFAAVCCAIAFFPRTSGRLYWLLYVPFIFFTAYVFPRIGYFYFLDGEHAEVGGFYTHQFLLSYPAIVLTAAAAYRLGGGSPGRCLKIAFSGMLIIFSGLLDVMWWVVNPVEIPAVIEAPHISIITGGPISFGAGILFTLAHAPILVGLNLLPLDRWLGRLFGTGNAAPVR